MFSFSESQSRRSRFAAGVMRWRLLLMLILVLAAVLIISAWLEIRNTRKELINALQEQALTIVGITQQGYTSAESAFSYVEALMTQKLLDNARFLEQLDQEGRLNESVLRRVAQTNGLFRVNVFDKTGRMLLSNMSAATGMPLEAPRALLKDVLSDSLEELVLGFRGRAFGSASRYAVAKQRRRGGAIVVNMDASEMLAFRREIGAGAFIRQAGASPGVRYAVVQDSSQVLLASQGVSGMDAISDDPFLTTAFASTKPSTRFLMYENAEVLEAVQSVLLDQGRRALLRIGLDTTHLRQAEAQARKRVWLVTILLFAVGALAGGGLIGLQYYRVLRKAFTRVEGYAQGVLDNMSDAVIAVNERGEIILFNRAAELLLGRTAADAFGKDCQAWPEICDWLDRTRASGENRDIDPATLVIGDRTRFIQASVHALHDPLGGVDMAFIVIRDRTEQKYLEDQVRRHEQITAMGHLAAGVAHEIRNPLNAIGMIAQRLRREFTPKEADEEYGQLTATLHDEAKRINEIIQQFLAFSRPAPLARSEVDMTDLISRVTTLIRTEADSRQVSVTVDCPAGIQAYGDAPKLQQALLNLLQNSLAACSTGGHIHVVCAVEGSTLILRIEDDGIGIPRENLNKIFNLYFTTRESGSGLGLSIVQQIISQHQGTIDVTSQEGQGTHVIITLPLQKTQGN